MKLREKCVWGVLVAASLAALLWCAGGCSTLDRGYRPEVSWTNAPLVEVFTNTVVVTNTVPVVVERTNIVFVTNVVSGAVFGYATREPVATNLVAAVVTNFVPVFMTNLVQVPVTNLVAKPEAEATIGAAGSIINTFAPGIGSIVALALGGLYHGYRQIRNRKVNEALVQGVETARAVCPVANGAPEGGGRVLDGHATGGPTQRQSGGEDDGAGDCGKGGAGDAVGEERSSRGSVGFDEGESA